MGKVFNSLPVIGNVTKGVGDLFKGNIGGALSNALGAATGLAGLGAISPLGGTLGQAANMMSGGLSGMNGTAQGGGQGGGQGGMGGGSMQQYSSPMAQMLENYIISNGGLGQFLGAPDDKGAGGKQEGAAKKAADQLGGLGTTGKSIMDALMPSVMARAGGGGKPGDLQGISAGLAPLLQQYGDAVGAGPRNANGMTQDQQQLLNQDISTVTRDRDAEMQAIRQQFAKMGITQGPALAAMLNRTKEKYGTRMQTAGTQARDKSRNERTQGIQNLFGMTQNAGQMQYGEDQRQFGNQQAQLGTGADLVRAGAGGQGQLADMYGQQAGRNISGDLVRQENVGSLVGKILGDRTAMNMGGFGGPRGGQTPATPNTFGAGGQPSGMFGAPSYMGNGMGTPPLIDPSLNAGTDIPAGPQLTTPTSATFGKTRAAVAPGTMATMLSKSRTAQRPMGVGMRRRLAPA